MLKKLSGYILALIGLTIIFTACKKEYESIQSVDSTKITAYIASNNLSNVMIQDSAKTGYYYQIVTQGTGKFLTNKDSVLYNGVITGMENRVVYSSSSNNGNGNLSTYVGYTNQLTGVNIPAIRDVMLKMRRGGTARILLPSYLAYGKNGSGDIPSNENIDLTITTYPDTTQAQRDDRLIQQFLTTKGLTLSPTSFIKDPSGVYYYVSAVGSGTYPITVNSTVEASYTGRLLDGTIFDSNTDLSISLSGAIKGWSLTLPGKLQRNGKIRMIIPSGLAYGTASQAGSTTYPNGIPSNAILDFDLSVISVAQ